MPQSRGRPEKRRKAPHSTPPPPPVDRKSGAYSILKILGRMLATLFSFHWKGVVFLSIVFGLLAGLFFFLPRVVIDVDSSEFSDDPFSVSFLITNTNIVPLEDLSVAIGLCSWRAAVSLDIYSKQGVIKDCGDKSHNTLLIPSTWTGHRLAPDEKYKVFLDDGFNQLLPKPKPLLRQSFIDADISIVVTFKPWISPIRIKREARFSAKRDEKGKIIWFNQTIDKP
jgi:hypothetical protein